MTQAASKAAAESSPAFIHRNGKKTTREFLDEILSKSGKSFYADQQPAPDAISESTDRLPTAPSTRRPEINPPLLDNKHKVSMEKTK